MQCWMQWMPRERMQKTGNEEFSHGLPTSQGLLLWLPGLQAGGQRARCACSLLGWQLDQWRHPNRNCLTDIFFNVGNAVGLVHPTSCWVPAFRWIYSILTLMFYLFVLKLVFSKIISFACSFCSQSKSWISSGTVTCPLQKSKCK